MKNTEQELWNLDRMKQMTQDYSEATGLASVIVGSRGSPLAPPCAFTAFCQAIRSDPERAKLCQGCDAHGGLQSLIDKSPRIYRCHAGLIDFCVPVSNGDAFLGAIASGQVRQEDDYEQPAYLTTRSSWQNDPRLTALYHQIPVYSRSRIVAASEILVRLSREAVLKNSCSISKSPIPDESSAGSRKAPDTEGPVPIIKDSSAPEAPPDPAPACAHQAALLAALSSEDLDSAFQAATSMLDEAFAAPGDLRTHLAQIEQKIVAVSSDCSPAVTTHLSELIASKQRNRARNINRYAFQLYIERLLVIIADEMSHSRPRRSYCLRDLLNEIARYPQRPYTLTGSSAMLHSSPGYFSKLFKSVTGCTFVSYINSRRLARAELMLAFTQMPVRTIAADLGFHQVNYFSRSFRTYSGMAPSEYRRRYSTDEQPAEKPLSFCR